MGPNVDSPAWSLTARGSQQVWFGFFLASVALPVFVMGWGRLPCYVFLRGGWRRVFVGLVAGLTLTLVTLFLFLLLPLSLCPSPSLSFSSLSISLCIFLSLPTSLPSLPPSLRCGKLGPDVLHLLLGEWR